MSTESHHRDFRLDIVSAACGTFRCHYRCPYCHMDYFQQSRPQGAPRLPLAEGVALCNRVLPGDFSLHLAGSGDPLVIPRETLAELVAPLLKLDGCRAVSLTTNGFSLGGRADELAQLGITDINVSLPCLDLDRYSRLMLVEAHVARRRLDRTLDGIRRARAAGLAVDLNVCVSYDIRPDLDRYAALSRELGVRIKLFPVIPAPGQNVAADDRHFIRAVKALCRRQEPTVHAGERYLSICWELDGGQICAKTAGLNLRPPECRACPELPCCQESCWRSVRISPWYIQPCGVRTDNTYWYGENDLGALRSKLVSGGKLSGCATNVDRTAAAGMEQAPSVKRQRLIVLEGPDGSGKSTVSRALARRLGGVRYSTPPKTFKNEDLRRALERPGREMARYLYYLSAMYDADRDVRDLLGCADVIADRWALSTHLYHDVMLGLRIELPAAPRTELLVPDLTIILDIDDATQAMRLGQRERRFDKRWEEDSVLRKRINRRYRRHNGERVVHVDSSKDLEDTIEACRAGIRAARPALEGRRAARRNTHALVAPPSLFPPIG